MPYCVIVENPREGQAEWERVTAHLRSGGALPPEGQRLLIAGPGEPGWRSISVWDSLEALERFETARLLPAVRATGCPRESARKTVFEIHTLLAGDLVGAPQPA
jgi:hypothetical protein